MLSEHFLLCFFFLLGEEVSCYSVQAGFELPASSSQVAGTIYRCASLYLAYKYLSYYISILGLQFATLCQLIQKHEVC